ncbi:condensation domain-containing protein [Nocardia abscessus]|uniref:condensation domain-containing protein n=1 Tax=Nocardia abscessus TaxID=120957 RepID=UPI00245420E4|nr:condensation domain-containing protein [Nocardia abscessus]
MKFPVLAGQADLLMWQEAAENSSSPFGFTMTFPAHVRPEHIVVGIQAVVRGFAALRLRFSGSASQGYLQEVEPFDRHKLAVEFHDVSDATVDRQSRYAKSILYRDAVEWDWARRGVYGFVVVKASEHKYQLVISLQHVAIDRASIVLVLNALRSTVLTAAQGNDPVMPRDQYESAVDEALLTPAAERAARRHWERELDLPDEAFSGCPDVPPARPRTHKAILDGEIYAELKRTTAAGAWGPSVMFLDRLISAWRRYQPGTTLIDVVYTIRSETLAHQVGMFSTIRPIIVDLGGQSWRNRIAGQLIRTAAHQQIDSRELRDLELRQGIPRRPFPAFNFIDASRPASRSRQADVVPTERFNTPYALARPMSLHISDTGEAFNITLQTNAAKFSVEESAHLFSQLAGQ